MNIHKNARLTFARRQELVADMVQRHMSPVVAADKHGVSAPTARKWLGRFLIQGESGLRDASSRPRVSPRAIAPQRALAIIELRRRRLTQARIARSLAVSESTVSQVVGRAGLSKLAALEPSEPVVRYEHAAPGDLVHIDSKKLGRIVRTGHRITGNPRDSVVGAGWEFLFVAVDDHARIAFTQMKRDERRDNAIAFLRATVAYFASLGITVRRILTDNGSAFRSSASPTPVSGLGSSTALPGRIGHKPMARPSASSNPPCASGPTASPMADPRSEPPCSDAGRTNTTGIARTKASAAEHPSVDSTARETTS